jgi:dolichyl-phosphate-mannose--protein O-mannosyl transferase
MISSRKPFEPTVPWFWIGIASIFLLSVLLRFWGLSRFNALVFDEVYFAKFANNYLTQTPFEDGHPPLGKYLIALGIWISKHVTLGDNSLKNSLTGSELSTFSYRWFNALTGSFIPLVIAGIAYQLNHRRSFALIAGLFAAVDGLFLVESRYALINIYLAIFGLLGQWLFLLALNSRPGRRGLWLALSGICFGASAAVKWNGLAFLLGIYLIWLLAWLKRTIQSLRSSATDSSSDQLSAAPNQHHFADTQTPLQKLLRLNPLQLFFDLAIVPAIVYRLVWIPHLQVYPTPGFWGAQQALLEYHKQVGAMTNPHPYCSVWYTWPWMLRPVAYYYQNASQAPRPVIYDVHSIGNPALWWLSTTAIVLVLWMLIQQFLASSAEDAIAPSDPFLLAQPAERWITLYFVLNYAANLLPWLQVHRCAFLYHYMGASVFALLAIAWLVDRLLRNQQRWSRAIGITTIFAILLAFVFWLPIYLGLPLSPEAFQARMWLRSWI